LSTAIADRQLETRGRLWQPIFYNSEGKKSGLLSFEAGFMEMRMGA
jgi:hypothetical protein